MELQLANVQENSASLQERLDGATSKVHELQRCNKGLCTALAEVTQGQERSRAIEWDSYSDRHKRHLVAQGRASCSSSLNWLGDEGFVPLKVEVRNIRTGSVEAIELNTEEVFGQNVDTVGEKELQVINMMLYIKDRFNISIKPCLS